MPVANTSLWRCGNVFFRFCWNLKCILCYSVCACVCVACIVPYNTSSSSWLFSHAPTHKILHWKETIKPPSFADAETWRYPPFDNLLIFFFFFLADSVQYIYCVLWCHLSRAPMWKLARLNPTLPKQSLLLTVVLCLFLPFLPQVNCSPELKNQLVFKLHC